MARQGGPNSLVVTTLGGQGWFLASGDNRVLVDPLLFGEYGNGVRSARYRELPPRHIELARMPSLSAVLLTHEHEDHFHLRTLNELPRGLPVYLSSRASVAAFTILREMGFRKVRELKPGDHLRFGSLEIKAFAGEHLRQNNLDEWDTTAFLALDRISGGCFFSTVDLRLSDAMAKNVNRFLRETGRKIRPLWSKHAYSGRFSVHWRPLIDPMLFEMELAAKPQPADTGEIEKILKSRCGVIIRPGLTFRLRATEIAGVETEMPFLRSAEEPSRRPPVALPEARPLTARDWAELESHLSEYARFLYGTYLFRQLCSVESGSFAFLLEDASGARVYEYAPSRCGFVLRSGRRESAYLGSCACSAGDLLEAFRGRFECRIFTRARSRWKAAAPLAELPLLTESFIPFFHPLRSPSTALERYRRAYAELAKKKRFLRRAAPESRLEARPAP